jgi:hypothetical protein
MIQQAASAHIITISDDKLLKGNLKELLLNGRYYHIAAFINDDFCHTGI